MSTTENETAALIEQLQAQIAQLAGQVETLSKNQPVPEEDLAIIAATAAAYLGIKGRVKAIQFAGRSHTTSLAS